MKILFTGRKAYLDRSLKSFAEEKLGKLERVVNGIVDAHVILKVEKHRRLAEIVVKTRSNTLTARSEATEFREAIIRCVDRLVTQGRKHHGRSRQRRRQHANTDTPRAAAALAIQNSPMSESDDGKPRVVRMGRIPAKPMSIDEALLQVRDSRDPFLVFTHVESQQVAVLFLRPDGRYGLVEAES